MKMYNIALKQTICPNALTYRIHVQYFHRKHKHILLVEEKIGYERVWKRQYSEKYSATHDLKNEVTTYRLSANQRLANKRLEQSIRN